jgi:hypothetical protein
VSQLGPPEAALLGLVALAWAVKCAVAAGAAPALLSAVLWAAAATAVAGVVALRGRCRWLDGWRLLLVLPLLAELPGVHAGLGGDGYEYYVFARSAVFDGDIRLANDFAGLGVARPPLTPEGVVTSRVPIGQSLAWLPFLLAAHLLTRGAVALGAPLAADGFSPPYQAAVTAGTYLLGALALLLLEALVRRRVGAPLAALTALALLYATPLHFYLVANPFMSHGTAVFVATLFVTAWLVARERWTPGAWLAAGAAGAFLSLVRAQDGVLVLLPLVDLAFTARSGRLTRALRYMLPPLAAILLQTLVWRGLYGPGFVHTVATLNWVGGAGLNVAGVLFSPRHGLFSWTPIYVLAVLGWLLLARREGRLALLCSVGFALVVLINAGLTDWWGSDAFGQRRLLVLTPLFGLGLGAAFASLRARPLVPLAALVGGLALWNQQLAYIYNGELVARRNQAITLLQLAPAQAEVVYRRLLRARAWLPDPLWALLYDNVSGIWIDEPPRSMGGRVDIGRESTDVPGGVLGEGWFPPEVEGALTLRRSRGRRSWLRLPIRTPSELHFVARVRPEFAPEPALELKLEWNGEMLEAQRCMPGWSEYAFAVPERLVRLGFNDVALVYSTTPRETIAGFHGRNAAVAVDWVRVVR